MKSEKIKASACSIVLTLAVLLWGCQMQESSPVSADPEGADIAIEGVTFPKEFQAEGTNVQLNMEVEAPEEAYFFSGTAEEISLDYEKIGRQFMPDDKTSTLDLDSKTLLPNETDSNGFYDEMFYWGESGCTYTTQSYYPINFCLIEEKKASDYNLALYAGQKEFAFASEEEALEGVLQFLENAGISLGDAVQIDTYYLDYETLQQEEAHYDMDGNREDEKYKTDWSEADNTYLFYIHQTYCGLEDYHHGVYWQGRAEDSCAQIKAAYSSNGICHMEINELNTYTMSTEPIELMDFDAVGESLLRHFENILDDAAYTVSSAQLCCDYQDVNGKRKIIPVWAFSVIETTDEDSLNYEIRMDASTGMIL